MLCIWSATFVDRIQVFKFTERLSAYVEALATKDC